MSLFTLLPERSLFACFPSTGHPSGTLRQATNFVNSRFSPLGHSSSTRAGRRFSAILAFRRLVTPQPPCGKRRFSAILAFRRLLTPRIPALGDDSQQFFLSVAWSLLNHPAVSDDSQQFLLFVACSLLEYPALGDDSQQILLSVACSLLNHPAASDDSQQFLLSVALGVQLGIQNQSQNISRPIRHGNYNLL